MEAFHELLDIFEDRHAVVERVQPDGFLRRSGQLSVNQQIGNLQKGAVFRQLCDVVSAIAQDTFVTIDQRDLALAACGVGECRIVGHDPEIIGVDPHLAEIHGANRLVRDRDRIRLAGPIIDYCQSVVGHKCSWRFTYPDSGGVIEMN